MTNLGHISTEIEWDQIESLQEFQDNFAQMTEQTMNDASLLWQQYQNSLKDSQTAKERYFTLAEEVEKVEIQIDDMMTQLDSGKDVIDQV